MTMQEQIRKGEDHVSTLIRAKATFRIDYITWAGHTDTSTTSILTVAAERQKREYVFEDLLRLQGYQHEDNKNYFERNVDRIVLDFENNVPNATPIS